MNTVGQRSRNFLCFSVSAFVCTMLMMGCDSPAEVPTAIAPYPRQNMVQPTSPARPPYPVAVEPSLQALPSEPKLATPALAPTPNVAPRIPFGAFRFADANHGWLAVGNRIVATVDGAQTWHSQYTATSAIKEFDFTSPQAGWAETETGFIATTDGGKNWHAVSEQSHHDKVVMQSPPFTEAPANGNGFAFCPKDKPYAGEFTALDRSLGWAFCTGSAGGHFTDGVLLYQTSDSGKRWELISNEFTYGPRGLSVFEFVDSQNGWIAPRYVGVLFVTMDGGHTWRPITLGTGYVQHIDSIEFFSAATGFMAVTTESGAAGPDTLLSTNDGGAHWRIAYPMP